MREGGGGRWEECACVWVVGGGRWEKQKGVVGDGRSVHVCGVWGGGEGGGRWEKQKRVVGDGRSGVCV